MMSGAGAAAAGVPFNFGDMAKIFGGSSIGAGIAGLLFPGKNPADVANPFIAGIPDAVKQYLNPYMSAGGQAMGDLQKQYGGLINDPGGMLNKIGAGYQQSPGFKFALEQALGGANRAAAAGGMAGSPMAMQENQRVATGLANQDYNNWLGQATGMYGQGLQGLQGINAMGYGASNSMANAIAQAMAQQAAYKYQGQAAKNQQQSGAWGDIFGGFASLLPFGRK